MQCTAAGTPCFVDMGFSTSLPVATPLSLLFSEHLMTTIVQCSLLAVYMYIHVAIMWLWKIVLDTCIYIAIMWLWKIVLDMHSY